MENKEVVVLGVKRVRFTNSDTGELVSGCSVFYYDPESINQSSDEKGYMTAKAFINIEAFDDFDDCVFPQICQIRMTYRLQGNRPQIKVIGFDPVVNAK